MSSSSSYDLYCSFFFSVWIVDSGGLYRTCVMGGLLYPCGLIGGARLGGKGVNKGGRLAVAGFFSIWFGDGSLMFVQPIGPRVPGACLRGERGDNYIRSGRKLHTSPHLLLLRLDSVLS